MDDDPKAGGGVVGGLTGFVPDNPIGDLEGGEMMAILEELADEVGEKSQAGFVYILADVVRYGARTGDGGASGLGEGSGYLVLTEREVISETREVDVRLSRGRSGPEEMLQKGCVDPIRSVPIWKGGIAGLVSPTRQFFWLPIPRMGRVGRERVEPVGELGFFDGCEIESAGRGHGRVVLWSLEDLNNLDTEWKA